MGSGQSSALSLMRDEAEADTRFSGYALMAARRTRATVKSHSTGVSGSTSCPTTVKRSRRTSVSRAGILSIGRSWWARVRQTGPACDLASRGHMRREGQGQNGGCKVCTCIHVSHHTHIPAASRHTVLVHVKYEPRRLDKPTTASLFVDPCETRFHLTLKSHKPLSASSLTSPHRNLKLKPDTPGLTSLMTHSVASRKQPRTAVQPYKHVKVLLRT